MCHSEDSRPPSPPDMGAVGGHERLNLTAADGNVFAAYRAEPAEPTGANVVVLPDVRGLHPFYEQLAVRFAEAGFTAAAMDYFGRTNGVDRRDDDFDWKSEIGKVNPQHVATDVAAVAEHLVSRNPGPVFTVGFCFGGSQSWRLAAGDVPLAGCIGFYGQPRMLTDVEKSFHRPMLMLIAGGDAVTPVEKFEELDTRLSELGTEHEMYVYDGAPHSFFDRSYGDWQGACDDAWRRMLSFTAAHD